MDSVCACGSDAKERETVSPTPIQRDQQMCARIAESEGNTILIHLLVCYFHACEQNKCTAREKEQEGMNTP